MDGARKEEVLEVMCCTAVWELVVFMFDGRLVSIRHAKSVVIGLLHT